MTEVNKTERWLNKTMQQTKCETDDLIYFEQQILTFWTLAFLLYGIEGKSSSKLRLPPLMDIYF